ncbi:hypothetical protein Efla_004407 [Eimeria flavescens]
MAHLVPKQTTVTAQGVLGLLADRSIRDHGLPENFISDRYPRFVTELWGNLYKQFQINFELPSAWHPQIDGQTERVHRTLEQLLRTYIQSDEAAWEDLLPAVELAYNCTTRTSKGFSPFEVIIGENPLRASDLDIVDAYEPTLTCPMTKLFQRLVDRAAANIIHAQAQQQFYAYQHRPPAGLPFSMSAFVCLLQKDKTRRTEMLPLQGWKPEEEASKGTELRYRVEHILNRTRNGIEGDVVKWKGYPDEDATWEPIRNLYRCKDLLRAFHANRTRQRLRTRREP